MAYLPARPDLATLRHQALELRRAAAAGDAEAEGRIRAVAGQTDLASAQDAPAAGYGFDGWAHLRQEVERRELLDRRDVGRLRALLADRPALATAELEHFCDHRGGVAPLNYIAMLRFDARRLGLPPDLPGTGDVARALLDAGAPVDGLPGDRETPLMTAASYGDAEVARVFVDAGADLEARAADNAGGVPGGTALGHAAVFGMTDVLDLLVASGARIESLELAAAAGDVRGWPLDSADLQTRIRALAFAADFQRLGVIDALLEAGTPIDAEDARWGRQPLRLAARNGRVASVRHLLERGADPNLRDREHRRSPLEWSSPEHRHGDSPGHDLVADILRPVTSG